MAPVIPLVLPVLLLEHLQRQFPGEPRRFLRPNFFLLRFMCPSDPPLPLAPLALSPRAVVVQKPRKAALPQPAQGQSPLHLVQPLLLTTLQLELWSCPALRPSLLLLCYKGREEKKNDKILVTNLLRTRTGAISRRSMDF